jgi:hypothetical protein
MLALPQFFVMITSISTWRCKCGVRVKVVSQTPKAEPTAAGKATCPNCGDSQVIYGKTILSITTENDAEVPEV